MLPTSQRTKSGPPKLSDLAKHLQVPKDITSTGWPAVRKTCVEKLGAKFDPWQDGAGRVMLAKRADGNLAAMIDGVGMSLPRQVGKTHLVGYTVFALCVNIPGLLVIWTAHHSATSSETFLSMQGMAQREKVGPHIKQVYTGSGDEEIRFHNGSRILFGARERGFGRGIPGVDVLIFDEAQILSDKAMSNMLATMNTSAFGLQLYIGTPPKPDDMAESFKRMRREALAKTLVDGAWIEFGADDGSSPDDRKQWAKANPSYPKRTPAESILRLKRKLTASDFAREGMGIWDDDSSDAEFPNWVDAKVSIDGLRGSPVVALDVRMGLKQSVSLVAVGDSDEGVVGTVSLYEQRAGAQWSDSDVVGWVVAELEARGVTSLVVDDYGENGPLVPLLAEAGIKVVRLNTRDMRDACMGVHTAFLNGQVKHLGEDPLDTAVHGARRRKSSEGWLWSREKSVTDVGPLMAFAGAWWVLTSGGADYDVMDSFY